MTINMGSADRFVRFLVGLLLIVAPFTNVFSIWDNAIVGYASVAVGLVLIGTAFLRFCPLYRVLGLSTGGK